MDCYAIISHFVFLILLTVSRQIISQIITDPYVTAYIGEQAVLPCRFNDAGVVVISWKRGPYVDNSTSLLRYFRGRLIQAESDRFNTTSDYSLTISDVTESDEGIYWCEVTLDTPNSSMTNLTVEEKPPSTVKSPATKANPAQVSAPDKLPIIIGCSIGGLILLALIVLGVFCCCHKGQPTDGYKSPKPV